jgi:PIN domain nuclease of toxin-antitoxin system
MASAVLDASALLALLNGERGADRVARVVADAAMSTVNLAETISKLVQRGAPPAEASRLISLLDIEMLDFTRSLAEAAAALIAATGKRGLSLGDRACLATAMEAGATAVTADRGWADLDLDAAVSVIR